MTTTTTNVATHPSNLNAVNTKRTDGQFELDEGAASKEESDVIQEGDDDGGEEGDDYVPEWSKSLTFEYMAEHEPFAGLPVNYLRFTGWARSPPMFALGIGVRDMKNGYDLARRLVPNEPDKDSSLLLAVLIHALRDRTNLHVRATPVRSKEVRFVFYIVTSWDEDFTDAPTQRDTMNAMLREINWREDMKWYIVGTWADKWHEDYNRTRTGSQSIVS